MKIFEAATIKSKARGLLRDADSLLKDKTLPEGLTKALGSLRAALTKAWSDLETEAGDEKPKAKDGEDAKEARASVGVYFEARVHQDFTYRADDMFGYGAINRTERIALSGAIGAALTAFNQALQEAAPGLYERGLADEPPIEHGTLPNRSAFESASTADITGDGVALIEAAKDGVIPIKIISPGWGSSGYYPAEVLKRDGPQVFKPGLQMFMNHPTAAEEAARPEGDMHKLAAVLVSPARWVDDHPRGPGLYAEAKTFSDYHAQVSEKGPHAGVSIRARGDAKVGTIEGKTGPIIERITSARSVDFVTLPGAGGAVLMESAKSTGVTEVNAEQLKEALDKSNADNAKLVERLALREAADVIAVKLAEHKTLPAVTRTRLADQLVKAAVVKDGALDKPALETAIAEAVKAEVEYLATVTGAGKVSGMGGSAQKRDEAAPDLTESFRDLGLTEGAAKIAAAGRN